jgi:predicted phosphodiesterase
MKIAVLADVHGNFIGLQTITAHIEAWRADLVIFGGDIINRGPRPLECLNFLLDRQKQEGWLTVRGNHEDYVISFADPETPCSGLQFEIHRSAYWTYQKIGGDVAPLIAMPFQQNIYSEGGQFRVVHGSMLSNRNGVFPRTTDEELREKITPAPAVICVAHTHWPLIRYLDETLVVNVGSAGLPFDGDDRLGYAQLIWQRGEWQARIIRLEYDKAQNERDFYDSGFMTDSGPLAPLVLDELRTAHPRLFRWTIEYEKRVLVGELTAEAAVQEFLDKL